MVNKAEQYFPTYHAKERDILLLEFEEAQKIANGQTKVYGQVNNILLALLTFSFTFFIDQEADKTKVTLQFVNSNSVIIACVLTVFGAILLRYFVDLQKQITINARKVVTLRTMLGLDYGNIQLTLPNWRVEGANNPYAIKYFNGWLKFKTMPFWLLLISVNVIWYFITKDKSLLSFFINGHNFSFSWRWIHFLVIITYYYTFRSNLNDRHETNYLNFVKSLANVFRVKLVPDFEYIIYRAKLSYIELDRLKVNYKKLLPVLVEIEDTNYYNNHGISLKSLIRGMLSRFYFFRKKYGFLENGGSTITMQLSRTLFIISNQNKYLRKIFELLLSIWLTKQFKKDILLKIYIGSVRYDKGVLGLANAIKHFFDGSIENKELTSEEAFFLVERLSNITSTVNYERINSLLARTLLKLDRDELFRIYDNQIKKGTVK